MLFNSYEFIFLFLPITVIGFYLIRQRSKNGAICWLGLASLFFYGYWSLYSLPILVLSIIVNYWLGTKIGDIEFRYRKMVLVGSVILNLFLLGYYKYADFFILNTNQLLIFMGGEPLDLLNVMLPIGISFFTFTQISFLIDSYQGRATDKSFFNYVLFVTFFPHLIAGPLLHHRQMMPQFMSDDVGKVSLKKIQLAVSLFSIGLAKKILIADSIGVYADMFFIELESGMIPHFFISWLGSFAYTFQLYFDFSGYTDMALGLALFLGIILPINFNSPFKSTSIIDFWQRWHMSLTKYIGEYLYTPITLKFMRISQNKNILMKYLLSLVIPTILIFTIIGFWHGASWTFIIFGFMHGCYVVINHLWRNNSNFIKRWRYRSHLCSYLERLIGWVLTIMAVNISFVIFRAENITTAIEVYKGMFGLNGIILPNFLNPFFGELPSLETWLQIPLGDSKNFLALILISFIIILGLPSASKLADNFNAEGHKNKLLNQRYMQIFLGIIFAFSLMNFNKTTSFLYFQF
mgnify:CR=1 FL=1